MAFFLAIVLSLGITSVLHAEKIHCDLIGENLKNIKQSSKETCFKFCNDEEACLGAVFISGWNRCFLKKIVKRQARLRLYSWMRDGEGAYDKDFSGKDLKRFVVADKGLCQEKCESMSQCTGFTYLEGYRDCWVKHTSGKLFEKIFYCSVKDNKKES
ncbi:PAN domain-containing protein [Pseudobacteriovorax antillogorgiicola]|uniref:PAN domain-containing protein n=1 Tax=Pseudobacteriovorax antillogorgiicola TaxID=1513793 RepID=A0A1Y6CJZ7_9BACT|nr:PAN domain-containing protein [Pseudobacteriovorax antillogorgiicola]TCS48332.1 PAN domain-containing protein [Pseudobacteriovorax antillogorgiicola]SMF56470.1 PAN domain-containing protein [Pseudobacteriovorax antillogorgiicola]